MKKLLKIVSVVILISTIAGCTLPQGSNVLHSEVSDDQIVEEAELIMDHLKDAADHEDYDAFEAYFDGKNEEDIRAIYKSFVEGCLDKYDQFEGLVIDQIDDVYVVSLNYYIVSGTHPNTHIEKQSFVLELEEKNGEFKIVSDENKLERNNKQMLKDDIYPEELVASCQAGRNISVFNGNNFMYLNNDLVYKGTTNAEVKFASQNEDGSVELGVWITNGTEQNIYYTSGHVILEDEQLGTILEANLDFEESVKSMSSTMMYFTISADQIMTGTAVWNLVNAHIDDHYQL